MEKVIVIRGPLGVGKSTISKALVETFSGTYISLDQIIDDHHLAGDDGIPVENFLKANEILVDLVQEASSPVVIDGCFYYQEQIDDLVERLHGDVEFFTLRSSVETCIERDAGRDRVYGEDAARFVHFVTSKIEVGHVIDNGDQTPEETLETIFGFLEK